MPACSVDERETELRQKGRPRVTDPLSTKRPRGMRRVDMTGQRYGHLVAVAPAGVSRSNAMRWQFRCDCGSDFIAPGSNVRRGHTISCGCYRVENGRRPGGRRPNGYSRVPVEGRLWPRVVEDPSGCWLWTGAKNQHGYGVLSIPGAKANNFKKKYVHRLSWELLRGEIPDGLHLDHLCRTPSFLNPWHLDPVTHAENMRRGAAARAQKKEQR